MSVLDRRSDLLAMAHRIDEWLDSNKDNAATWVALGIMLNQCRQLLRDEADLLGGRAPK